MLRRIPQTPIFLPNNAIHPSLPKLYIEIIGCQAIGQVLFPRTERAHRKMILASQIIRLTLGQIVALSFIENRAAAALKQWVPLGGPRAIVRSSEKRACR